MELLRALLYGLSPQRPSHSLYIGGEQLPLEARMGGIFLGFFGGLVLLGALGRLRARQPSGETAALAAWGCVAFMAVDGLNALFFDLGLPHAYAPNLVLRLLTGLAAGYGLVVLALPVAADVVWREPEEQAPMADYADFGAGAALLLLLGVTVLADVWLLLWPVALAMVVSVVIGFSVANVYLLALVQRARETATGVVAASAMRGSPAAAIGLALVQIAALGLVRGWMTSLGVTWGG